MPQNVNHDVLILGTGLAGLRAAVEIARQIRLRDLGGILVVEDPLAPTLRLDGSSARRPRRLRRIQQVALDLPTDCRIPGAEPIDDGLGHGTTLPDDHGPPRSVVCGHGHDHRPDA